MPILALQMARVPIVQSSIGDDDDEDDTKRENGLIRGNAGALVVEGEATSPEDLESTVWSAECCIMQGIQFYSCTGFATVQCF
jgi:hypothetical protein